MSDTEVLSVRFEADVKALYDALLDSEQALERVKRLHTEGVLSEQQYQQARASIATTTEARLVDLRRQTEATLNDLRRSAAEANGRPAR